MPVHQPHPAELIPIPPPFSVSLEFGDIELLIGASLSWNAFLVTTHRERECIYKSADLTAAVVESLEEALLQDFRKIGVRRCVWQKEIECALLECKKDPKSAQSSSGQQNVHRDPYAPAADHSILAAADESNPYQTLRKNSDVERASSDSSRNPSPDVSDDDDDLTAISKKSSRHKKKKAPLLITNDKHNESPINPLENIRVNKPYQPLDQPPSSAPTVPYRHESPASSFPLTSAYRGSSAFVGIENQANTCYLNAALQSLYHIPYFRSCMYKVSLEALRRKDVVEALQSLFAALQLKHEGTTTVPLTSAFRWSAEDLRHQHDAHEMILILFDCIEKQICSTQSRTTSPHTTEPPTDEVAADEDAFVVEDHDTEPIAPPPPLADAEATKPESTSPPPQRNFIQKLFHGEQMYYTSVPEAQYTKANNRSRSLLWNFPCSILTHLDSLEASLDEISKPTIIEGFNVDHPDGTKSAHNAERTLRFSQLPPVLLIHPNRVVFDFEKLAQVTVNNRWSFPVHLDLAQHTRHTKRSVSPSQDLSHADGLTPPRARDADIDQVDSSPAPVQFDSPDTKEPGGGAKEQMEREGSLFQQSDVFSMTDYELRTVVLHSGTAASGHYIACVHHGNGEWTCFNDDRVHSIMESEVMRRAFGGIPHSSFDRVERAKLLVYVRKPSAPRLLAEVPIPEAIQASASIHEKKLVLDCKLMCEAFADGLGGKMMERIASTVFRIEFRAAATLDEVYVILGKKLTVDPHRLVMWKYGYHYVE
ncbi:ubiquitin hydrolase, putative, partial [Bodo saltans]